MKLYSLLDKKLGEFGGILMAMNDGHMSRILQDRFENPQEGVAKHAEDYDLYEVGEFFEGKGRIVGSEMEPRFVVNMAVILKPGGSNA